MGIPNSWKSYFWTFREYQIPKNVPLPNFRIPETKKCGNGPTLIWTQIQNSLCTKYEHSEENLTFYFGLNDEQINYSKSNPYLFHNFFQVSTKLMANKTFFYNFRSIFQVSIQLNVIHFSQILWVVWLMAKTMCLAVKGTMFLMFVRYSIAKDSNSDLGVIFRIVVQNPPVVCISWCFSFIRVKTD